MNLFKRKVVPFVLGLVAIGLQPVQAGDYKIIGKHIYGLMLDSEHDPLLRNDRTEIYQQPDSSLDLAFGNARFTADTFKQPVGAIYLTKLGVDKNQPVNTAAVDSTPINGISEPTSGIPTDWGSVLYSEASLVDSANPESFIRSFQPYFDNNASKVNAYEYGWPLEMIVLSEAGESKLIKNFAMGRTTAQALALMPDEKSVWMLSSGHAGYLYLFVADDKRNLSRGQLFVADTRHQPIRLVALSHTSTLKAKYRLRKIKFKDLITREAPTQGQCDSNLTLVQTVYGIECLELKDKRNAGLFEPHRVSALVGVKPEFSAFDSLQFNQETSTLILTNPTGKRVEFTLGLVDSISSDYVIKERL